MATQPGLRLRLQATPTSLGRLREALRDWLQELGLDPGDVFDVVLACSECLTLMAEDRPRQVALVVDVSGTFDGERIVVTVRDYGLWHESHELEEDEPLGLSLMRALMDSVELERHPDGRTITLARRLAAASPRTSCASRASERAAREGSDCAPERARVRPPFVT
jgi:anti-sigma regulatory factor (Ser/Thr protein kinase)